MTAVNNASASAAKITSAIKAVVKQASTVQDKIQTIGIDVLLHAYNYGDYTLANTLVNELPDGVRKVALVEWFKKFGGLTADNKGFNGWAGKEHIKAKLDDAKKSPWYKMKPEPAFKEYDLKAALATLVKNAQNKAKERHELAAKGDDKADKITIDNDLLAQLGKLLGA